MPETIILIPIQRQALAMLIESSHAFADMQAVMIEHSAVSLSYDEIAAVRAAVELGRRAIEGAVIHE